MRIHFNKSKRLSLQKHYFSSKVLLTTPIFYVNATPHIGHLYTLIYTDSIREWLETNDKTVYFSTGTDEHGIKLQKKVRINNKSSKGY
jgi:methionyl-tRNA synthetase